ncbi:MAG: 4Fe-4S dicluster domain-containing protein [Desulforegulaceae bacterium]|nr:4Fe-4S dicluster domain-containing protein [Desulforegulaceae bacterium]
MKKSRRRFLKIAGVSALGLGAGSAVNVFASAVVKSDKNVSGNTQFEHLPKALSAKRWAIVIDTRKLNDKRVEKIQKACHLNHNVPEIPDKNKEIKWIWSEKFHNVFPEKENKYLADKLSDLNILTLCNHCENPPCVRVCPTKATFKRDDGIVMMDFHRCIGCRFCMAACPYGSRSFNFFNPRLHIENMNPDYPTRQVGVVEKCNLCDERLAEGKAPYCVEASDGAIAFGDLEDPKSDVRRLLKSNFTIRRRTSLGTGPCVYYIV